MFNNIPLPNILLKLFLLSIISFTTFSNIKAQCSGTVYDSGGSGGNYVNNANVTTTYTATAGNVMKLTFTTFNTESGYDKMWIYDGPNTSSPLLSPSGGLSGNKNAALPGPYTASGTTITIRFTSDASTTATGWSINLSCVAACSNTTVGGTIAANETVCGSYNPANMTSSVAASGGSGTITYQWESSLNNSTWADISGATATTYDPLTITQTTYYRRKSKTSTCTIWGATSNTITKTVVTTPTANAGSDISQCYNSAFQLIGTTPSAGQTPSWSIVSGTPLTYQSTSNDSIIYSIPSGQTATLRYTVSNGTCSSTDDVIISNTTACVTTCTSPLNSNGDLETEGNATSFPLSFQSTPAAVMNSTNYIPGWADRYSGNTPNTTSFTGAYYIKKTGVNSEPHSGTHMIYLNGSSFCLSSLSTSTSIACGRTYKFSAWVAAYTNSATQVSSPFAIEFFGGGTSGTPANYLKKIEAIAPASTSWNDLNWQRYEFTITIPANGYAWADYYFTPLENTSGIVIDDVCITEVSGGSYAYAGSDNLSCSNSITLGATAAAGGYTGTWSTVSGSATFASATSANTVATITSGNYATLRWTVSNGSCSSTDEVVIGHTAGTGVSVNDEAICTGWSTTLNSGSCSGNLLWNTGATTSSITVNPTSTTTYSVTCTPTQSSNLILNGGFESSSDFGNWTNWQSAGITTTAGEFRTGSKAARIIASSDWGGFAQELAATPGQFYTVSYWAKMNNTNAEGNLTVKFLNSSYTQISNITTQRVTSTSWVKYTLTALAPINTAYIQISADAGEVSIMYVDDVEVYRSTGCTSTDSGTVTVITNDNITLGTPVVSAAINHPLLDVATVTVQVSWTSPPANDKIKVVHNNKIEYIDVGGGATSPQTITFMVEADGDNNKVITASWLNNPSFACPKSITFASPAAINNQKINCDILFLCGLDKPYDGDPWDHGMINYITQNSTGTVTTALTKTDASGYGLYDWANSSTLLNINLDNYDLVIVSATTEGHIATGLIKDLAGWKGSVLNMNYDQMQELGYGPNNYVLWGTAAYTSQTSLDELYNFDNLNSTGSPVFTISDYYPQASASLWSTAAGATNSLAGISFKYSSHSNLYISSTHGPRVFLGYHMNGIYANAQNGGALPAPITSYFSPLKHLTLKGKEILDNALVAASLCSVEICDNNSDDDGDGLSDCYDPDCGQTTNREFDGGTTGWNLYQNGASGTFTIDNTSQLLGYNSAKINTTTASGTDWHLQFAQIGKSIVAGKTYKFSFKAKAASNRTISAAVDLGSSPWTSYLWQNVALTTSGQLFSYTFTAPVTINNNIRTLFNLGTTAGNVWLDDIRLEEVCSVFSCPVGYCESTNLAVNGSFTTDINNWTATNGQLSLGTGGTYGNFVVLNNPDYVGNYYVYQDVNFSANTNYKMTGYFAKHGSGTNAKMYLEFYNGTTFISKSSDYFTTYNFDGNFQPFGPIEGTTPANTTKVRIVGYANGTALKFDEIVLQTCSQNSTNPGTIAGNQSECGNYVPSQITSVTPASGGSGSITYEWEVSTDSTNWTSIASTNSASYTPSIIYQTSYYRRKSKSSTCNEWSNYSNVIKKQEYGFDNFQVLTEGAQIYNGGAHIHGPAAMGGDLTINSAAKVEFGMDNVGSYIFPGDGSSYTGLLVGGKVNWTNGYAGVLSSKLIHIGNSTGSISGDNGTNSNTQVYPTATSYNNAKRIEGTIDQTPNPAVFQTVNYDFASLFTNYRAASINLGSKTNTVQLYNSSNVAIAGNNVSSAQIVKITALSAGFNYLNLTTTSLNNITELNFSGTGFPDATKILVINVPINSNFSWNNVNCSGINIITSASNVLWNFYGNTTYTLTIAQSAQIVGTVFAPNLNINKTGTGDMEGSVVAKSSTLGIGELHYYMFSKYCEILTCISPPLVSISGGTTICAGQSTTLNATTSGGSGTYSTYTWNNSLGTGTSKTVSPVTTTTYIVTVTDSKGCTGSFSITVTVNPKPTVSITGASAVCVGSTTTLSPTTGGTWVSSNTAFATVTNAGVVTGVAPGTATFTFTNTTTGCISDPTSAITTIVKPTVSITGSTTICIGSTSTLSPTTGGTWVSSNTAVATVTNAGVVTGVAAGSVTFTFTNTSTGCTSNPTNAITINPKPAVSITGSTSVCVGATTTLSPTTGGTWISSNTAVATVTNVGLVTGIAAGTTTFTFTSTATGCVSNATNAVTIIARPTVSITGASTICEGATTTLSPTTGGTWVSSNAAVASVTNAGVVTGIAGGTATFTFTNTSTGCVSNPTAAVTINAKPIATFTGSSTLCVGGTTTLTPSSGGTWSTSNFLIASINNSGAVTALLPGTATFTFTQTSTGCVSNASSPVTVNVVASVSITGPSAICIGGTTTLEPSTGGTWSSSNNAVATVTNAGVVTGVSAGTVNFTYSNVSTNCVSNATSNVTVNAKPTVSITGATSICVGSTTTLSPTTGGSWTSSDNSIATVTNAGVVTGVNAGSVTFTFTNATTGCSSNATNTITIIGRPVVGITGATSICEGSTTTISPTSGGTWVSNNAGVASVTNAGVVTGLTAGTATFTFTNTTTGCVSNPTNAVTISAKPSVSITGPNAICVGSTSTLSPTTGGTWVSNNTTVASVTNAGLVTGLTGGTATFTFTNTSTACVSNPTASITINTKPAVGISGSSSICIGSTTTLFPSTGGTWTSSNTSIATVNNSGVVTGVGNGSVTFTFTNSATGCTSNATAPVAVGSSIAANIDYMGSVCLKDNAQISVSANNGTAPFTYNWTGPSSFTGSTQTISITNNGNYYVTVTDAVGCSATTSGFVYQKYEPFIVSLTTEVCEGQPTNLSVSSSSAVGYLWSANAGNATTANVTVYAAHPSSTYAVTVTNDLGCTAVPTATITAKQKPTVNISGSSTICVGTTTTLTPSTGGTWSSSNSSVATVNNAGVVTGVAAGTATFIFTNSTTGCASDATAPVTVYNKPVVFFTGPTAICINSQTSLSPSIGGTWTSSNTSVATVNNSGSVTGVAEGTVTFTFTSSATGCTSNASATLTVDDKEGVTISGPNAVCMGSTIQLQASKNGGIWSSNDTGIATVNGSSGVVTPVSEGMAVIKYFTNSGSCQNESTYTITVNDRPVVSLTGANTICVGNTTSLSPATGGTWSSSNTSKATVNNSGIVTGVAGGTATFTFTSSITGCTSLPSSVVTVNPKPAVNITGPSTICVGANTSLSPTTGGTWTSSNTGIATVSNAGVVTGVGFGNVTFTFTSAATGCVSNATSPITIGSSFSSYIDYNGSICLTDTSKIKVLTTGGVAPFNYNWAGPSGFSGASQQVSITSNGNYYVTVTDAVGCSANVSGYVYERYEPVIINLNTTVCEGQAVGLNVSAGNVVSYLWSSNAGNATTSNVTVVPVYPSSTYKVSVTNNLGCLAVASATINVNQKPVTSITGNDSICVNNTTTLSPTSGGSWSSNNPSIATITNAGVVTGLSTGTATFTFTNSTTNCASNPTDPIVVNGNQTVSANGPTSICIGDTTYLLPSSGGIWTSANSSIATVNNNGRVIAMASGITSFNFTNANTGCPSSNGSISIMVNNKPITALNGDNEICISGTTSFIPTTGGSWISNNPSIATITNNGVVTGTGVGSVSFVFEESATGCRSDNTIAINVVNGVPVGINGDTSICIGSTTQLTPATGGTWTSGNTTIASVTNNGIVTGVASGEVYFTYFNLATGCSSITDVPIVVIAKKVLSLNGPSSICIGSTTSMNPSVGGTWTSNNPSVATINNSGIITGISEGNATFVYTDNVTGCVSNNSPVVTVYSKPSVSITGPGNICIGSITTLSPTSGGTWISSNTAVATVSNSGIVTGISLGSANFTFFETNSSCVSDPTNNINVISKPTTSVTGANTICTGSTTTLAPTSGGAWISNNPSIATVNNSGVVTAVSQGVVTFTFVANGGCTSDPSAPITINGKPSVSITGPNIICAGNTSQMSPSSGGTWTSLNPGIASINNSGFVTGLAQGGARFRFTSSATGCISDPSNEITVNTAPAVTITGPSTICIGATTQVNPTNGGIWVSSNPAVASVNSSGHITGITAGQASFTFTHSATGCSSLTPISVTVNPKPTVSILGSTAICIGYTTTLSPSSGGVWTSNNTNVATVTNSGIVTGINQGSARFYFTDNNTGCVSNLTAPVVVNPQPTVLFTGPQNICIGSSTTLSPTTGGTWSTSNAGIATVTNNGVITGIAQGSATFIFTDASTGCISSPTDALNVNDAIPVSITGSSDICMDYTTTLSPSSGGFWTPTNTKVASVSSSGVVLGLAPGKVSFYFTHAVTGCVSHLPDNAISVENCIDPDFNVTLVNNIVYGDLSTNDEIPNPATYHYNFILDTKPSGSLPELTVNSDGTYNFKSNMVGKYWYSVPVCIAPQTYGCPTSQLTFTVVDPFTPEVDMVLNTDITSVYEKVGTSSPHSLIKGMVNDDCISTTACDLEAANMSINNPPSKGTYGTNNANLDYWPMVNYVGKDTMQTMICEDGNATNCAYGEQIITIRHSSAKNTVVASDDFFSTNSGGNINSNVLTNDSDPESDNIAVLPQGDSSNLIVTSKGSYYILGDGTINFTPLTGFTGNIDIVYTVCDDNSTDNVCVDATAHILVFGDMSIKVRVYLEGSLMSNNNLVSSTGKPLMRDNLRNNPFDGKNHIPVRDPYKFGTPFVDISLSYQHIGAGLLNNFDEISDSTAVFSVEGENAIVDWVFVEIRSKDDSTQVLATRAGLLQRDGDVVDLDGQSDLFFPGLMLDSFYVAVKHRSHLGAMSKVVQRENVMDFTSPAFPLFDFGTRLYSQFNYDGLAMNTEVKYGYRALWAGNANADNKIKFTNPGDDQNNIYFDVLADENNGNANSNFDFTIGYYQGDYNMNGKAKFDNPNDDKNMLYSQLLTYGLNVNYLSNFNFFIQQIP